MLAFKDTYVWHLCLLNVYTRSVNNLITKTFVPKTHTFDDKIISRTEPIHCPSGSLTWHQNYCKSYYTLWNILAEMGNENKPRSMQ